MVVLGGGGATHGQDAPIDDFVMQQTRVTPPRVGFLGWATDEAASRLERVRRRLQGRCLEVEPLAVDAETARMQRWLDRIHVLYVAGGHTDRLLQALRAQGRCQRIADAVDRGLLIVGVSAGASVWFECALSDAGGQGLRRLDGLGLWPGSFCPHYDSEPARRPAFEAAIAEGRMPAGLAVDDGVAVLLTAGGAPRVCRARPGALAYRVCADQGVARVSALP